MTIAQNKIELAKKLLQTEDKRILKAIELLFHQEKESFEITSAEKRELDKRLAEIDSGGAKFYSLPEVKKLQRKKTKIK